MRTPNVPTGCYVILSEYYDKRWHKIRTTASTKEKIANAFLYTVKVTEFYKFECYDIDDTFLGTIFTVNTSLF